METIFALASALGKAGVSVIRVSGPKSWHVVTRLSGSAPPARVASVRKLYGLDGDFIDEALVLVFEEGASFTGERVSEFHVHGSVAVIQALLRTLGELPELRLAEPGEFTRRALVNERLDLSQVEALGDLIDAETEQQRQFALRLLTGALGERVAGWRERVLRALALLEATIDFADEDVPIDVSGEVKSLLDGVSQEVTVELEGMKSAERVRLGFEVAIVGPPNVGKSTLLNYLAGREAAITSDVAGTTRDVIEVRMNIAGLAVTLLDTAGLRESVDSVEKIGISRAKARAVSADLRVHLVPTGELPILDVADDDIVVTGKADLGSQGVSGKTGLGVPGLLLNIEERLKQKIQFAGLASRERHRVSLQDGLTYLGTARSLVEEGVDTYEFASEEVRLALTSLEQLVGHVDVENVLDQIFSSFCIGK